MQPVICAVKLGPVTTKRRAISEPLWTQELRMAGAGDDAADLVAAHALAGLEGGSTEGADVAGALALRALVDEVPGCLLLGQVQRRVGRARAATGSLRGQRGREYEREAGSATSSPAYGLVRSRVHNLAGVIAHTKWAIPAYNGTDSFRGQ